MKPDLPFKSTPARRTRTPYFVLVLTLLLTALATYYVAVTARAKDELRFENAVDRTENDIQNRLETYITLLRTGSGLFAASEQVGRDRFYAYVSRLELRRSYPGIQGIGFSARIMPSEKDAFVAAMRKQGVRNFAIRPDYKRAEYHSIIYVGPLDRRNKAAIGFDMFTESVRRAAMESARDTDAPTASGKVTLIQEIDKNKQAGFLIYVPVYRNGTMPKTVPQRRAALHGFIYSAFRADDLMAGIFGKEKFPYVDFQIYDGTEIDPKTLLHSSYSIHTSNNRSYRPRFKTTATINIAGRPWSIVFVSRPELDRVSEIRLVPYIALGGVLIGLLLFGITRSQVRARIAAERLATDLRSKEAALRESESQLRRLVDANIIGIIIADMHGNIIEANDAFLKIVGYSRSEATSGINWWEITPPEYRHLDERATEEMKKTGSHPPFEKEYIRKDGTRVPVLVGTAYLGGARELGVGFLLDLTEQKRAEELLRISETRFRTLIEQSPLSTQILSPDGRTIRVNKAWEELWGVTLQQIGDYNILEDEQLVSKGIMPYIQKAFAGEAAVIPPILYDPNQTIPGITSHQDPRRWVQAIVYPVKDEAGKIREVVLLHEDITSSKHAEEALRGSQERFRRLFDSNLVGVSFWNVEGYITEANDAYLRLAGYTREEFAALGRIDWRRLTPPEYKQLDDRAIEECMAIGVSNIYEKEYVRRDGKRMPIVLGVALLNDSQHDGVAFVLDIAERKKAEEALRESEERFQAFMNHSPTASWITDEDGRIVYLSETYTRIFKMASDDAIGKTVFELYTPEIASIFLENIKTVARTNEVVETIEPAPRLEGTLGDFLVYKFPISDASGRRLVGGVAIDITDRLRAQKEREQLLTREQAARNAAEAANRMKDEFLATLSHELRTPLNAMVGWTTLLRTRKFDETTTARALETIDRNTKALSQLIEDLLDVSRIMTGKFHIEMRPVNLASVMDAAIDAVRSAAEAKNIQINSVFEDEVSLVSGDPTRLQQIAWNLLTNAIKFTPKGGRVEIRLARNNSDVQITVTDTGQGISVEFLPYLFERFRQADASITRKHGGLGLGLAIVRHLVELHGGRIRAQSPGEGQGSTFIVSLPLRTIPDYDNIYETFLTGDGQDITRTDNDNIPLDNSELHGLWVLIVDDEPDARDLVTAVLEKSGAKVTAVASAKEAFAVIAKGAAGEKPDILISDIGMPEEDGYTLIRKIRALGPEQGGRIPALALTAYARAQERESAIAAGFHIHVAKPVVPEELIAVVASLVNRF